MQIWLPVTVEKQRAVPYTPCDSLQRGKHLGRCALLSNTLSILNVLSNFTYLNVLAQRSSAFAACLPLPAPATETAAR